MISERSELLGQLLRYHALLRGVTDRKVQDALHIAIEKTERRLADIDTKSNRARSNGNKSSEPRDGGVSQSA